MIEVLATKGAKRDMTFDKGLKDKFSRRFSSVNYTRVLSKGENCDRDWLVYSKDLIKFFALEKLPKISQPLAGILQISQPFENPVIIQPLHHFCQI